MTTKQKIALAIPLLIAAVAIVGAFFIGGNDSPKADDRVVEALIPGNNDKVLQQSHVGIDLQDGWDGSLQIDGTPIPLDQTRVVNSTGQITFQPTDETDITSFPAGEVSVRVDYHLQGSPTSNVGNFTWSFTVKA